MIESNVTKRRGSIRFESMNESSLSSSKSKAQPTQPKNGRPLIAIISASLRPFRFSEGKSAVLLRSRLQIYGVLCFVGSDSSKIMSSLIKDESIHIREVWSDNLEEEFALIRGIVDDYPYVAMDSEFPGVVIRPVGNFKNITDYNYQTLKDNVDMLKLIQLGLTFSDENGNLPTCGTDKFCIWQFNFREFDVSEDVYASDSIDMLKQCGIDFKKNNASGIDSQRFGELLMSSGVVLNDSISWVTFHSGYDFGYLLKVLTCCSLPETQAGFFNLINMYFPVVYDIKHLMKFCNSLHGGLNKLAELLDVARVGMCHQAGSDSLLTCCTFMKLKENFFNGSFEKYAGVLYGLGVEDG